MPGPSTVALSDYLAALRRLLHDASDVLWPLADKTAYLNEAIQQRDLDTGGRRTLGTFTLTPGTDTYSFTALAAVAFATANLFDIINITLINTGFRVVLEALSYSELNSVPGYRVYVTTTNIPAGWCRYGDQSIIIAPVPAQAYQIEIDALVYSIPALLVALTDTDVLQFPYTYPVPLYAAYLAKQNERQYDEADWFKDRYSQAIVQINSARTGMVPSMYR
jgi:hypothetical protein